MGPLAHVVGHRVTALWQNERTRAQLIGGAGLLAGVGAGIASYAFWREPMQVHLDHLTIRLPNATNHLPTTGLRLLHISDTHFRGATHRKRAKIESIRKACAGLEYDLLIHTGDFLHHDSGLPNVVTLLDALPVPRLGGYAVFGNHDYTIYSHRGMIGRAWFNFQALQEAAACEGVSVLELVQRDGNGHGKLPLNGHSRDTAAAGQAATQPHTTTTAARNGASRRQGNTTMFSHARTLLEFSQFCANSPLDLKRTGRNNVNALEALLAERRIQVLHNRFVRLTHTDIGLDIYLAGVDDVLEGTPELPRTLAGIPYDAPTILLSHNPDIIGEPGIDQADLILAGHTHGGQIVLPLIGPVHTQCLHLGRGEASGYLRRGNTQVYITRGVGEGIPLRLGAAPQITLITVLPA